MNLKPQPSFSIVIPCFNENETISQYLNELDKLLMGFTLIIIDDASSDNTLDILNLVQLKKNNLIVIKNPLNLGHGRSLLIGLQFALDNGYEHIVSTDGDGQTPAAELLKLIQLFEKLDVDILEGCRINRNDPWFRKLTSFFLKLLILSVSHKKVRDANTPVRIYKSEIVRRLIQHVPEHSIVPNLQFSFFTRKLNLNYIEESFQVRDRLGNNLIGTTWNQKFKLLPSKKFIFFCVRALNEIISIFSKKI